MTFTQILQQVYDRLGIMDAVTVTTTPVYRRLAGYINEAHEEILGTKGFQRLRRRTLTFSTVANLPYAVLPQPVDAVYGIKDTVNRIPLIQIDPQDVWWGDPALASTGANPLNYALLDQAFPVIRDPSDASELYVKSISAGDTTQVVYVEGITSGGSLRTVSVTLTGTTAVNISTGVSWLTVTKFYLSAPASVVILTEDSGIGTTIGSIDAGRIDARYSRVQFWPTPSQTMTLYADVDLTLVSMVNANDSPLIPLRFHYLMVAGALKREYEKREKTTLYGIEEARWTKGVARCRSWINTQNNQGVGSPPTRRGVLMGLLPGEIVTG